MSIRYDFSQEAANEMLEDTVGKLEAAALEVLDLLNKLAHLRELEQIAERMADLIQQGDYASVELYESAVMFRNWKNPLTPIPGTDHTEGAW